MPLVRVALRKGKSPAYLAAVGEAIHQAMIETINVPDAYADPRFDRNVDLRSGYRTLNMLVVPVWDIDGRKVIGVLQVLNKRSGPFERRDQMLLERIAEGVGPMLAHIPQEEAS